MPQEAVITQVIIGIAGEDREDDPAIELAEVGCGPAGMTLDDFCSVRHQDTDYDSLLMSGVPRDLARDRIRPGIDRILASWA
jgi:hypothetical protein